MVNRLLPPADLLLPLRFASIHDSSEANEIPPNTVSFHWSGIKVPSGDIILSFWIFAVKYQDKAVLSSKTLSQIWYFKTAESWTGINDGTAPSPFLDASISEREDIISHLSQELKDYLE